MCNVDIKRIVNTKQYIYLYENENHINCIGRMTFNFGKDGLEFLHRWKTLNSGLKSDNFSKEFTYIVNELRKNLLRNCFQMQKYIESNPTMSWIEEGRKMAVPRTKRRKNGLSSTAAMIGLTLLIGFIASVVYIDSREMRSQQQSYITREATLERQIEEEKQRTLLLTEKKKHTQTKQYVEEVAKDKLGLVYPDEVLLKAKED